MRIGDMIEWRGLKGHSMHADEVVTFRGVIVGSAIHKWDHEKILIWQVLDNTGRRVGLREDEPTLKLLSSTLTDKQLENVVGGMSAERFSHWRAEKLNEDR